MKNLHSATGLSNSFLLSALAILASCSTPKYYQFNNRAVSSSITADTLVLAEALESTSIEPVTSFADPAMALQLLAEAWVDSSLFSTEQSVAKKQFRRELRKMVKEDPLWNSLASTANPLPTLDDEKQRKEDGVPPMNKVALLAAIFSTISLLGLVTPVFWLFVLPALILGIIGLRKIKQSGERGRGLAVVAIALSSLFLLLFIFVVVQIALLAGEG